jgi:RimJ/RimL family protein N-acetyltransferase
MNSTFFFELTPQRGSYTRLSGLNTLNPFHTEAYAQAQQRLGAEPVIIGLKAGDTWTTASIAFMTKGRLRGTLTVPSVPPVTADSPFWPAFLKQCRVWRLYDLELESFACLSTGIPRLAGERKRLRRAEFYLDLPGVDLVSLLSKNHRHSIKRARLAGLELRRSRDPQALQTHTTLMATALDRHRQRGEQVPTGAGSGLLPLLETGSGELFQALQGESVLSSALVISSPRSAYYHSAGTAPEGLSCGASQFLVHSISVVLQEQGVERFFLGGTDQPQSGVALFKSCFGATKVDLEAASAYLGNPLRRRITSLVEGSLRGRQWARFDRFYVYSIDPAHLPRPIEGGFRTEKLSDEQVRRLPPEFAQHAQRLDRYGFNDAYGLFDGERVVHVVWLIAWEHDRHREGSVLDLKQGEAELAHAQTASSYRGKGLFPHAITSVGRIAAQNGIRRLYAIVAPSNSSSMRALEKAGGFRKTHLARIVRRFGRGGQTVLFRGHRWIAND